MQTDKDNAIRIKRLSSDSNYYNNVFKKTEKIVSVTFYILSETKQTHKTDTHIQVIKDRALKTHELSLSTLTLQPHEQTEGLLNFQYGLVALESTLKIAQMAGVIPQDIMVLLSDQLDSVLRIINNHYLDKEGVSVEELTETVVPKTLPKKSARATTPNPSAPAKQKRVIIPSGDISSDAYLVYSQLTDRADRIKTILEAKPGATVKDVAEVITDVSEKTIQRELNSLIEKGEVTREGERRWSKYSVSK